MHSLASPSENRRHLAARAAPPHAGDALASAFVLFELGDDCTFRAAVRFREAIAWFEQNQRSLDAESHRLWDRAKKSAAACRDAK